MNAELKEPQGTYNPLNPLADKGKRRVEDSTSHPVADKYPGKKFWTKKPLHLDLEKLLGEKPIDLTLIDYYPANDQAKPIIIETQGGVGKFNVYLNYNHAIFRDFHDGYEDLIYMEAASIFFNLLLDRTSWTLTRIYYELKTKYASETMLSVTSLVSKANNLMRDIQNKLVTGEGMELGRTPILTEAEQKMIKGKYLEQEKRAINNIQPLLKDSRFLNYLDLLYLFKFIKEHPEIVFDGKILDLPYLDIEDEEIRHEEFIKYMGYFNDVRWFMLVLQNQGDEAIKKMKSLILHVNKFESEIVEESNKSFV